MMRSSPGKEPHSEQHWRDPRPGRQRTDTSAQFIPGGIARFWARWSAGSGGAVSDHRVGGVSDDALSDGSVGDRSRCGWICGHRARTGSGTVLQLLLSQAEYDVAVVQQRSDHPHVDDAIRASVDVGTGRAYKAATFHAL